MKQGIRYKDVTAMPGSELHALLLEIQQRPEKSQELRKNAETLYNTCESNYRKLTGG